MDDRYTFSVDWFSGHIPHWQEILSTLAPVSRVLEIGSYEGQSACFLIEECLKRSKQLEIHCIDTFKGGSEHSGVDMNKVEEAFHKNTGVALEMFKERASLYLHKERSLIALSKLLSYQLENSFDFIYIDGSHHASDVLSDSCLAFELVRPGGIIIWDDYLWVGPWEEKDQRLNCPKLGIDFFLEANQECIQIIETNYQLTAMKTMATRSLHQEQQK